jgi:glycerol dehydrogenase-like iron-containing ADH family enzyme
VLCTVSPGLRIMRPTMASTVAMITGASVRYTPTPTQHTLQSIHQFELLEDAQAAPAEVETVVDGCWDMLNSFAGV